MEPEDVTFQVVKDITNDFSEERILGKGAFGVVYRGVTKNGEDVAVKMLHDVNPDLNDKQFQNEFYNLTMLKHKNIVQVLGYCYETEQIPTEYNGRTVLAEKTYRVLCFEYLDNGSLQKHLCDEFHGLDWNTRYKIIKGSCEGLKYIHEELEEPLYHLDLKPDNILLDKNMVPKIADFGLSRIFCKEVTRTTLSPLGTIGYQPPEYIKTGEISKKFDIFSLGVVLIKILSGHEGYSKCGDIPKNKFIDLVQENWRNRLQATLSGSSLEAYCHQVETCTRIALSCVEEDSQRRLDIINIIDRLNETETHISKSMLLHVEPLQLCIPFEPYHSMIPCSLQLSNNTDHQVAFRLLTNNPEFFLGPLCGVVPSRDSYTLTLTTSKEINPPENRDKYFTLESCIASDQEIQYALLDGVDSYNRFFTEAKENNRELHQVKLAAVYEPPIAEKTTTKFCKRKCQGTVSGMTMHNDTVARRKKPKEVTDQHQHLNLMTSAMCNVMESVDIRELSLVVGGDLVVGRTEEKKKVMVSILESIRQKITIFPIYGIGGIGKTTFAKLIYNDINFKKYSKAWAYISPRFDLNKICNSIISQLTQKVSQASERHMIHSRLAELFSGKNILIVLDDLWEDNPFQLEDLKATLNLGDSINTVVLVTTRSEHVAEKICMNVKPYKIESLTNEMCWDIIRQRSGFEARDDDKEHLTGIGREIALKCGGVALAAQSIGFMLQSMTSDQWMNVKDSDIWNESFSEDASLTNHVLASLKLSYNSMAPDLRSCFTYCAIFPKGHKMVKDDLIHQWIALGFIKSTKIHSTLQKCEKYIVQLLGLSFLQPAVSSTIIDAYDNESTLFTMHDLVHDLARLVMGDEFLDGSKHGITEESSCKYVLLNDCRKQLESTTSYPHKIKALCILECGYIRLHGNAFSSTKFLRVLDLSACRISELPASIGELVRLRYLKAQNILTIKIPDCFNKLSELIYLNLSGSEIQVLPESTGEIKGLMYLDVSDCAYLKELPKSFVNFKKLVHLDLSNCQMLRNVSDVLCGLTNIQYLNLSRWRFPHDLPEVIGNLIELRYLSLSGSMGLDMMWLGSPTDKVFDLIDPICTLPKLEHLDMSANDCIVSIPEKIGRLRKLRTLDLSGCSHLVMLPECVVKMDSLKILNVNGCPNLRNSTLSRPKSLFSLPHFVVHADDGESRSNINLLRHAYPNELHISSLHNVDLLRHTYPNELHISSLHNVKCTDEVKSIRLIEKQRIHDLKLEWTRDARRYVQDVGVLGDLVPPCRLKTFTIKGYTSVSFPTWVIDIKLYLPRLVKIVFWDLSNCNSLPPLGQLPNLQELVMGEMSSITTIDVGFCGGSRAFPQLREFCIYRMENLESWSTLYYCGERSLSEFMFPNLVKLSICDCPMLRLKPCPPRVREWKIENSDNVLSSWVEGEENGSPTSAALTDMIVTVKSSKLPFNHWRLLHYLFPFISTLSIITCTDLTCSSPEIIRDLSSIKSLCLVEDKTQTEHPKWLGDLITLRKLVIIGWTELSDLQDNMQHLSSLQELSFYECPSITALPVWLGNLTALQKLVVSDCRGIKSLPESIQKLPKLKRIIICCPELTKWCEARTRISTIT